MCLDKARTATNTCRRRSCSVAAVAVGADAAELSSVPARGTCSGEGAGRFDILDRVMFPIAIGQLKESGVRRASDAALRCLIVMCRRPRSRCPSVS